MRNQYKILAEKYSLINEDDKEDIMAGLNAVTEEDAKHYARKPVIMTIDYDSGGEFANIVSFRRTGPFKLPDSAIPATELGTVNGLWVDPKQPQPDYVNIFLKIYVTTDAMQFAKAMEKDDYEGPIASKYIKASYDFLGLFDGLAVVPGANWIYDEEEV